MHHVEVKRQMGEGDIASVLELLDAATAADGHRPLGEHQWLDLVQGGRKGFAGLVAWEPGHDHPVGYAQVTRGAGDWAIEFVIDPHHRESHGAEIGTDLLRHALAVVASEGGGHVHVWVPKPHALHDAVARGADLRAGRELLQMRRPLPTALTFDLDTRPFVSGQDDVAWLEVNNRAFRWHPEQGGWDLDTLRARQEESWFDPRGFLLHEREGRMAGFCWTKIHDNHEPQLGEIYVIAVDPDFQGLGLGRALVLAGLDSLASRGTPVGMLYVDAANKGAVQLYEALGFEVDHVDRAYTADVTPASEPSA